jgi:hypothetical protein
MSVPGGTNRGYQPNAAKIVLPRLVGHGAKYFYGDAIFSICGSRAAQMPDSTKAQLLTMNHGKWLPHDGEATRLRHDGSVSLDDLNRI